MIAAPPTCATSQLHVWVTHSGAALGTVGGYLAFTNRGSTCVLRGWPTLTAVGPGGTRTAVRVRQTMFGPFTSVRGVPPVRLRHGWTAVAAFTAGDHGPTSAPCGPDYRTLRVTPPGNTRSATVSAFIVYYDHLLPSCTGIEVSMVVAASNLPAR
jgi:uncharacterized protein DUF4232